MVVAQMHAENVNWSNVPIVLSEKGVNAFDPQIAIDPNGYAVAAWIENHTVKSKTKYVNGTWNEATILSGPMASSVKLVLDNNGNVTAIWLENGSIKTTSKSPNGNWNQIVTLSDSCCYSPSLIVDNDGNVIAAWVRNENIETSTKYFESHWQPKVTLNSSTAANPIVAIGGSGSNKKAVIVWQGVSNGVSVIFSSMKFMKGNWNSPKVISELEYHAVKPSIDIDQNGNALAVWLTYDKAEKDYFNVAVKSSVYSSLKGNWSATSTLSLLGNCNPKTLKTHAAYDIQGNAIAFWNTSLNNETYTLQSAVKLLNSTWSDNIDVLNDHNNAFAIDLFTSLGDILVLYMNRDGNFLTIQSIELNLNDLINNFRSMPITISQGTNNAYPRITASLSGNIIHTAAVWICNNGINNQVVGLTGFRISSTF